GAIGEFPFDSLDECQSVVDAQTNGLICGRAFGELQAACPGCLSITNGVYRIRDGVLVANTEYYEGETCNEYIKEYSTPKHLCGQTVSGGFLFALEIETGSRLVKWPMDSWEYCKEYIESHRN